MNLKIDATTSAAFRRYWDPITVMLNTADADSEDGDTSIADTDVPVVLDALLKILLSTGPVAPSQDDRTLLGALQATLKQGQT